MTKQHNGTWLSEFGLGAVYGEDSRNKVVTVRQSNNLPWCRKCKERFDGSAELRNELTLTTLEPYKEEVHRGLPAILVVWGWCKNCRKRTIAVRL